MPYITAQVSTLSTVARAVAGRIEHHTGHDIADLENTPHTDLPA